MSKLNEWLLKKKSVLESFTNSTDRYVNFERTCFYPLESDFEDNAVF